MKPDQQERHNAERASLLRRKNLGEDAIVRCSHVFEAPKGTPQFPLQAWVISLAVTSQDGLLYVCDLVMLSGDTFIILPDFKRVCYVKSEKTDSKSIAPLLAHKR